jgi:FrmR/RcnR family transcriptional regulator, repressor of frmRAB operon
MAHTIKSKSKLIARVRRIKGQVEAVERALEAEIGCADVLMLVASLRGAVHGLTAEVMEDHIRNHIVNPDADSNPERARGAAELIDAIRTYLK